jgi:cobalt ECF transporter T component CbiQ
MIYHRAGYLEHALRDILNILDLSFSAELTSERRGPLQRLDPRVKLAGWALLVLAASASRRLSVIVSVLAFGLTLAVVGRVPGRPLRRLWLGAAAFAGAVVLPAIFLTPGTELARVPLVDWPVTRQGVMSASYVIARVLANTTISAVLIFTTPWSHLLKAMRSLGAPTVAVVLIGMTYRYIFLLAQTAADMLQSRRSRMVGPLDPAEFRRIAIGSAGVLLSKSFDLAGEVHLAMQARGYRGEVKVLEEFSMRRWDWMALAMASALGALALWWGMR